MVEKIYWLDKRHLVNGKDTSYNNKLNLNEIIKSVSIANTTAVFNSTVVTNDQDYQMVVDDKKVLVVNGSLDPLTVYLPLLSTTQQGDSFLIKNAHISGLPTLVVPHPDDVTATIDGIADITLDGTIKFNFVRVFANVGEWFVEAIGY